MGKSRVALGTFDTAVEAAAAYARAVGGEQARAGRAEAEARSAAAHPADPARRGQRSLAQAGIEEAAGSACVRGATDLRGTHVRREGPTHM